MAIQYIPAGETKAVTQPVAQPSSNHVRNLSSVPQPAATIMVSRAEFEALLARVVALESKPGFSLDRIREFRLASEEKTPTSLTKRRDRAVYYREYRKRKRPDKNV